MTDKKKNAVTAKKTDHKKKPIKKGSIHDPGVKGTMHDSIDTKDFTPSAFHGK